MSDAVNTEVETSSTTDSAPVENNVTAENALDDDAFDDIDESQQETDSDEDGEESQEESNSQEETETDQPEGDKPLAPKSQNRFQKLANENKEIKSNLNNPDFLREQLQRLEMQNTQVATEQALLNELNPETGQLYTPQEAERAARQQTLEEQTQRFAQEKYDLEVQQSQQTVGNEAIQALKEFPMLDETSSEFIPEIAEQFDQIMGENTIYELPDGSRYPASVLVQNGVDLNQARLLGTNISPYKLAKLIADSSKANSKVYEAKAQRSVEKMQANADVIGGTTQAGKSNQELDDFDAAWDE